MGPWPIIYSYVISNCIIQSQRKAESTVSYIKFSIVCLSSYSFNCVIAKKEEAQEVQECYLWYIRWDYNKLSTVFDLW